ncbi:MULTISPECIES: hypothetical protein [Pseudomonas]|uniref:hypothetical protein n=1 Tax=Pseudomonas TaxID=286 RepID=UPI000CD53482|nr:MULTISPECIES: hypothetical protein [Pseudomonas]RBH54885.1 hypothetical protein C3F00_021015 [Pseudomonas sp. MWU13-2860]
MKQQEALVGIADRITGTEPLQPETLGFSLLEYGEAAFELVLDNLVGEFPFLWNDREYFEGGESEQFDRLFCWLVREIFDCPCGLIRPEADLAKLLAVAAALDCDDQLWGEIYRINPVLPEQVIAALASLIKESHVDSEQVINRHYCSDSHVREIKEDIANKDWRSVEWIVDQFWMDYRSPIKLQAAAALHRYNVPLLQSLIEGEKDFFEVASYTHHAPIEKIMPLAVASQNWTFKFWAFHRSVTHASRNIPSSPNEWELLLREASKSPTEWSRWLSVINEYPSRYPQIQEALGSALAHAEGWALDIYVSSMSMITPDMIRKPVASALSVFRQRAALKERKWLWQASFNKWKDWDFDAKDKSKHLFSISSSCLDYAVIGYFVECLDARQRHELIEQLRSRAVLLDQSWHPSTSSAMTERFKLASTYQPLAQAELACASQVDWHIGDSFSTPPWEDGSLYRSLRYDTDFDKPTFLTI